MINSHGLPTRAPVVSHFMMGLEKMKAKLGEVSRSARALTKSNMLSLYRVCVTDSTLSAAERASGTLRYVCTHFFTILFLYFNISYTDSISFCLASALAH